MAILAHIEIDARHRIGPSTVRFHLASPVRDVDAADAMAPTPTCKRCSTPAYAAESIDADGRYHARCFTCATCGSKLRLGTFRAVDGDVYCVAHATARARAVKPNLGADALEIATYAGRGRTTTTTGRAGDGAGDGTTETGRASGSTDAARAV